MVQSMTGFGKASGRIKGRTVQVEVRSLNSKALELGLRLPQAYKDREPDLRRLLSDQVKRGKTDLMLSCDNSMAGKGNFNNTAIKTYIKELQGIAGDLKLKNERFLQLVLSLPDSMKEKKAVVTTHEWRQVLKLINNALGEFGKFRRKEGKAIEKDLVARLKTIQKMQGKLESHDPARQKTVRDRLDKMLNKAESSAIDNNRFEQELIYYLERMDITEEKIRLKSHCIYFMETIRSNKQNGKKLGFISQEMGREINTIGAKANDAFLQRIVVMMKDELEKIKEQLANVL